MKLSELIDSEGVEKINLKTNISIQNLNYLKSEDYESLNRVRALGFLLILEREYKDVEVQEIRERVKLYYDEHESNEPVVVVRRQHTTDGSGFSFFKWFIILGILGGGWYLYTQGNLDGLIKNIQSKQDFFDDNKALESNVSDENANRVMVRNEANESVNIETPEAPLVTKSIVLNPNETTELKEEKSTERVASNEVDTNTIALVKKNLDKNVTNTAKVQTVLIKVPEALTKVEEIIVVDDNKTSENENTVISTITINPTRGMLWFGFINMDTKKRHEFMKDSSVPFDIKDGRWLLVTGHGFVDIVSEAKNIEVADRNKHYFYIDSSEIRELSQKEFRDMNGRRGW